MHWQSQIETLENRIVLSFTAGPGSPLAVGAAPFWVALGDVNGDGKPDLLTANFANNNVSVLLGVATPANSPPTAPADNNSAANSVLEGAANGTTVGVTAFASDPNGDTVTYSLTNDAGGRFGINSSTGVVTVGGGSLLNYETAASHTITVQASDGATGTPGTSTQSSPSPLPTSTRRPRPTRTPSPTAWRKAPPTAPWWA